MNKNMNPPSFAVLTLSDVGSSIKFFPTEWEADSYSRACYTIMGWHSTVFDLDKETYTYYEIFTI